MTHAEAVGVLTGLSCLFSLFCVIFHAIAFGTRRWFEGDGISPFLNLGFHEACFKDCYEPWCPGGDESVIFDGCWWVHDYHFESIWWWLIPEWFLAIRDLAIGVIPLTVFCLVLLCIATSIALAGQYTTDYNRNREIVLIVILFVSACFLIVTGSLCLVILARFYMNSYRRDWMPMPERNHFGYSFWLELTTATMLFTSFVMTLIAAVCKILDISTEKETAYAEDMMLGRR